MSLLVNPAVFFSERFDSIPDMLNTLQNKVNDLSNLLYKPHNSITLNELINKLSEIDETFDGLDRLHEVYQDNPELIKSKIELLNKDIEKLSTKLEDAISLLKINTFKRELLYTIDGIRLEIIETTSKIKKKRDEVKKLTTLFTPKEVGKSFSQLKSQKKTLEEARTKVTLLVIKKSGFGEVTDNTPLYVVVKKGEVVNIKTSAPWKSFFSRHF